MLAIAYSLTTGALISANSIIMRHYVKNVGFTPLQLNIDGYMISGCALAIMYLNTSV